MIKHFCDVCGEELKRNYISERLKGEMTLKNSKVMVEVHAGVATWNSGDICVGCLFRALNRLDTRPRAAEQAA